MESSLQISRQLWPFGFRFEYNLAMELAPASLSLLADGILQTIVPRTAFSGGPSRDLKGRDPVNLIDPSAPSPPTRDELLYIEGDWPSSVEGTEVPPGAGFALRISSVFDTFPSAGHIQHRFEPEEAGDFPPGIPPQLLGFACPIRLTNVRLGMDLFSTFFISSLAGFAPSVTGTLLMEASESQLFLRCVREGLRDRSDQPLPAALMTPLERTLQRACNFDLAADIERRR